MKIIYLDQNQWIRLARARKSPSDNKNVAEIGATLDEAVRAKKLCLPLTATNIYETYKINDSAKRENLAIVQANLSGGKVFVGRHARLNVELGTMIREMCDLPPAIRHDHWFLSDVFFEAFSKYNDSRLPFSISDKLLGAIENNPADFLFDYWMSPTEEDRLVAVRKWSEDSNLLRQRLERKRAVQKDYPVSLKRKAYSAALLMDECDLILRIAREAGAPWISVSDIGPAHIRQMVREAPIYYVEREIALKLEAQGRPVEENDFRDMASFCAVIPYADCVVAEKQFINLAIQSGLGKHYHTILATQLNDVVNMI